jgi:hypothetical protein
MMKSKLLIGALSAMLLLPSVVGAAEGEIKGQTEASATAQVETKAGIMPGNWFYFIDRFMENVWVWTSFGTEAQAKAWAQISEERWAEYMFLQGEARAEYEQGLKADYESSVQLAIKSLEKAYQKLDVKVEANQKVEAAATSQAKSQTKANAQTLAESSATLRGSSETKANGSSGFRTETKTQVQLKTHADSELSQVEEHLEQVLQLGKADLGVEAEITSSVNSLIQLGK